MTILEMENELSCDTDAAWQVLADFGNFLVWATGGAGTCELEGEGVGMIRHLDIPGLGKISERLDGLDDSTRTLAYTLVSEDMAGMKKYGASVRVVEGADGSGRLQWRGEFEAADGLDPDEVKASLSGSYTMMAQGLEAYVNAST